MRRQYQGIRTIQYLHKYTTTQSTNMTIISKKQVSSYLTSCFSLGADEFINCDLKGILHFHSSFSLSPAEKLLFLSQPMWTFLRVTKSCWENFESGLVCDLWFQASNHLYNFHSAPHHLVQIHRLSTCYYLFLLCFKESHPVFCFDIVFLPFVSPLLQDGFKWYFEGVLLLELCHCIFRTHAAKTRKIWTLLWGFSRPADMV